MSKEYSYTLEDIKNLAIMTHNDIEMASFLNSILKRLHEQDRKIESMMRVDTNLYSRVSKLESKENSAMIKPSAPTINELEEGQTS